jgi:hypothetical protein
MKIPNRNTPNSRETGEMSFPREQESKNLIKSIAGFPLSQRFLSGNLFDIGASI